MSSAQSVASIGVGACRPGGCEQVRTVGALELPAALHRTFGTRTGRLVEAYRSRHPAGAPDGPRQAGLAQYPDGRFDPLAPLTKEYVHAR